MAVYMIGYDLMRPGQNYDDLFTAIQGVGSDWWHCLDSTWMVVSDKSAAEIRNALVPHMDKNDKLLVVTLAKGAAWKDGGFTQACVDWIRRYL